jgi:asparagine synthase (glutamine-hydrolysing)
MSTFYALFQRTGVPLGEGLLADLDGALAYWQPDVQGCWHGGNVVLSHAMLWNSPESQFERLPAKSRNLVITCDVRLDNREELQHSLRLTTEGDTPLTDSDLLLAAYANWGKDCPQYLLGDFAFVIWDGEVQQLFCVRDHLGVKPLYFHVSGELFFCGNDLKSMACHPAVSLELDGEAVANFLVHSLLLHKTKTLLRGIFKLPAGHWLTVTATDLKQQRYWRAQDVPKVILPNARAYAERLRELLELAVSARTRSMYRITSHLSGGIDSSSIAVLAAKKLKENGETLLAFNWLHQPGKDDDPQYHEWANSRTVAEAEEIEHYYVHIDANLIQEKMMQHTLAHGDSSGFWYEYFVRAACQKNKSRTILSGWGGDELATYHGQSYLSDLFITGKWWSCFLELLARARKGKRFFRTFVGQVYRGIILPLVPRCWYKFMPRNNNMPDGRPLFVSPEFMDAFKEEQRQETVLGMQPQPRIRRHMEAYLDHGHLQARMESWAASAVASRLEYSYPLLDRRVVEFVLGVPCQYFVHDGVGRYLFRKAMTGAVADAVLWDGVKREDVRVKRLLEMTHRACTNIVNELCANGKIDCNDEDVKALNVQLAKKMNYNDFATTRLLVEAGDSLAVILSRLNMAGDDVL